MGHAGADAFANGMLFPFIAFFVRIKLYPALRGAALPRVK